MDRVRRTIRTPILGALWVAALAVPVGAQSAEALALNQAVNEARAALRSATHEERPPLVRGLSDLEHRVEQALAAGVADDGPRLHMALSKLFGLRATFAGADLDQRLEWRAEATRQAEASNHAELIAGAHVSHASELLDAGRLQPAKDLLEHSLEQVDAPRTRPWTVFALASADVRLGLYATALARLEELEKGLSDDPILALFAWRIPGLKGQIHLYQGLVDVAAPWIEEEFSATRPLLDARMSWALDIIAADVHRANLYLFRGQFADVVAFIEERLTDTELFDAHPRWRNVLRGLLGQALERLSADDEARRGRAEALLQEVLAADLPQADRIACELALARLKIRAGDLTEARASLDRAAASTDQAPASPPAMALERFTVEASLAFVSGADHAAIAATLAQLERAWDRQLSLWAQLPPRRAGHGFLSVPARRAAMSAMIRARLLLEEADRGAQSALELVLDAQEQSSAVRARGGIDADIEAIRAELLESGHGVALFLPAAERSHLFLLDRESVEHYELASEARFTELHGTYRSLVGDLDARKQVAHELARDLLPEAARTRIRSWSRLTFVQRFVDRLPLEELAIDEGATLGATHAIGFLPSLPLGLQMARAPRPGPPAAFDLLLLLSPDPAPEVEERWSEVRDILGFEAGTERFVRAYRPERRRILEGADATAAALFEPAVFENAAILQFVTHGVEDRERERPTALVLAPDAENASGLLTCDHVDAESSALAPAFVILTACGSGRGPRRGGDESAGHMGGAWLARGARAVLLADDDLTLGQALDLSAGMHRELAGGSSPADALRAVRSLDERAARGVFVLGLSHVPVLETGRPAETSPAAHAAAGPVNPRSRDPRYLLGGSLLSLLALLLFRSSTRRARTTQGR